MRSRLRLLRKTSDRVLYAYSVDESIDTIDGEIEYNITSGSFTTNKNATNDDDGNFAEWLYPHVWRAIYKEQCPLERYIVNS